MLSIALQTILPFFFSAVVVIVITLIAEKYGTKTGGILGTLPSTIIVAYIFIALNKGILFASSSAAVVPAEMGINLIFLFAFALLIRKSVYYAFIFSFAIWSALSIILLLIDLKNIYISISIFFISLIFTFVILEKLVKIRSIGQKVVHYTFTKIVFRGVLAGIIITISVLLSNIGEVVAGIMSVFPAIFSSTMLISYYEHGPSFASGLAKSMIIGSCSVMSYAVSIHFLYPAYGILFGSIGSLIISIIVTFIILQLHKKLS